MTSAKATTSRTNPMAIITALLLAAEIAALATPVGHTYYRNVWFSVSKRSWPCPAFGCGLPSITTSYRSVRGGGTETHSYCPKHTPATIDVTFGWALWSLVSPFQIVFTPLATAWLLASHLSRIVWHMRGSPLWRDLHSAPAQTRDGLLYQTGLFVALNVWPWLSLRLF